MRRSTFTDQPVTYAAVGATLAHDLTMHPPKGFRPSSKSIRLGSGDDRFEASARALMTWGIQRASGVEVRSVDPGTGEEYAGVRFAEDGTPQKLLPHRGTEAVFDEDGHPYISNGMTALLRVPFGPFHVNAPVRVVYVIEEDRRVGFGYGTMHGHPLCGEEAFIVEQHDDDSVWLTMRSFSRGAAGGRAFATPFARMSQASLSKRYLRALHPVSGNQSVVQPALAESSSPDAAPSVGPFTAATSITATPLDAAPIAAIVDAPREDPVDDSATGEVVTGADEHRDAEWLSATRLESDGVSDAEHPADR